MAQQQIMEMATLGRVFHLGMLYDVRSDAIIPGVTLWDPKILANNTNTFAQPYTGFEVFTEDSLQTKAHALGVEAGLKLSLLSGLITVSGSAKYAEHYQATNHEVRVTLKYSTTTRFEQLTMEHLGKGKLNYPDLEDVKSATHVVTGVLYGAEAFFVFDRTISYGESKKEISGSLRAIFDKPIFKMDGEAKLNLTDEEKNFDNHLHCTFHGDLILHENPNTFTAAVELYHKLPSLLGKNYEKVVPKRVWLYPLNLLDNKAMRYVREISSQLIDYSISMIENLHSLEIKASDLLQNDIFTYFNYMKKHLIDFIARLSEIQRDLKENIALYLPKIRGYNNTEEFILFNLLKQVDLSPFNKQKLESWLEGKRREIELITTLIKSIDEDKTLNITIKSSSLYEFIGDLRYPYIFCLSFRFAEQNHPQLIDMYNYRYDKNNFKSTNSRQKGKEWFEDKHILVKVRKNVQQFIEFSKGNNAKNGKIKFIVNEEYSFDDINKGAELILYNNGLEKEGFLMPSKPGVPYPTIFINNSVMLEWTDAANGTEKVEKYKIMYRKFSGEILDDKKENEKEEKWIEVYTNTAEKKIIISNLTPNMTFVFKVQSITAIGLSTISDLSKPIELMNNLSKPIEIPTKNEQTNNQRIGTTLVDSRLIYPIPSSLGMVSFERDQHEWKLLMNNALLGPFGYTFPDPLPGHIRKFRLRAIYYDEYTVASSYLEVKIAFWGSNSVIFRLHTIGAGQVANAQFYSNWYQFGNGTAGEINKSHSSLYARLVSSAPFNNRAGIYYLVLEAHDFPK